MRKLLLLLTLLLSISTYVAAQNYTEVVYLKNGSVIKGVIIEQVPNVSLKIKTNDGSLIICQMNEVEKITKEESEVSIMKESVIEEIKFKNYMIKMEVIDREKNVEFSNNALIKLFDYDKIEERIVIRNRKDGDKMKPLGIKGTKKLKDIFINLKVPREERDVIPLICFDDEIAWIVGYKVSESFKITKSTKRVLKISFEGKE